MSSDRGVPRAGRSPRGRIGGRGTTAGTRLRGPCAALLLFVQACGGGEGGDEADAAGTPDASPGAPVSQLHALSPATPAFARDQERGVGVLHLEEAAIGPPGPPDDTLTVREAPSDDAAVVARLFGEAGAWRLEAAAPATTGAAVAFGYEQVGLPVVEERGAGWVRVRYATGGDGDALEGWARADGAGGPRLLPWSDLLPGQPLWFLGEPSFHAEPGGERVAIPIEPGGDPIPGADYILWPLETRGSWVRVEAVTPSDYCFDPAAPRRDTAWVRYLDDAGRPLTWFYTRGC